MAAPYPVIPTPPNVEDFVRSALKLHDEKAKLAARIKEINESLDALGDMIQVGVDRSRVDLHVPGRGAVRLLMKRSLTDGKGFREDYPYEEHPYLYSNPSPSTSKMDNQLPPEELEKYVEKRASLDFRNAGADPFA